MIKKVQTLGAELTSIAGMGITAENSEGFATIEPTLFKLNEFINKKIKISDFTPADK